MPVYPVATLPYAIVGRDDDITGRARRVAGGEAGDFQDRGRGRLTAMPDSVAVRLGVTVSVAVIVCVPAVSSVTEKLCCARISGDEGVSWTARMACGSLLVRHTVPVYPVATLPYAS